jgi:hypothetical protein
MSKSFRLGIVLASAVVVVLVADSRITFAQRITIGGGQGGQNRDKDEDDDDEDENNNNQGGNRSSRNQNSSNEQIQKFLQGRQGGQNNQQQQNNTQQFRNRQGQDQQFQGQGQFQQFQQFRPQENQQGGLRFGGWQGNQWQGSRDVEKWAQVFRGGEQPFSDAWYKEHPKAWKHGHDHDHDDFWVVSTLPGVYGWLGWGNAPGVRLGNVQIDYSRFHDFYPLGVYSLMSGPGDMGTRIVQLAIDRHGHISGNYYDMIADANYSVSGDVRRDTQRVTWSLNKNKSIRFRASLNRLLQPYGSVIVQMPGGEQDWQFVRLEN